MAAKLRKKKGPLETECREIISGVWQWETEQFKWQFREGVIGRLNLSMTDKDAEDETLTNLLYCKNLDAAVMFSQGYDSGFGYASRRVAFNGQPAKVGTTSGNGKKEAESSRDVLAALMKMRDLDGLLYDLRELVVSIRNTEEEAVSKGKGNPAEADYWRRAYNILDDASSLVEAL